jgi:hypothetical protein
MLLMLVGVNAFSTLMYIEIAKVCFKNEVNRNNELENTNLQPLTAIAGFRYRCTKIFIRYRCRKLLAYRCPLAPYTTLSPQCPTDRKKTYEKSQF